MQDHIEDFLGDVKNSKAKETFKSRQTDLNHFDDWLESEDLNVTEAEPRDIHRFFREQGRQYAEETMRVRYASIKLLYDFLAGVPMTRNERPAVLFTRCP